MLRFQLGWRLPRRIVYVPVRVSPLDLPLPLRIRSGLVSQIGVTHESRMSTETSSAGKRSPNQNQQIPLRSAAYRFPGKTCQNPLLDPHAFGRLRSVSLHAPHSLRKVILTSLHARSLIIKRDRCGVKKSIDVLDDSRCQISPRATQLIGVARVMSRNNMVRRESVALPLLRAAQNGDGKRAGKVASWEGSNSFAFFLSHC